MMQGASTTRLRVAVLNRVFARTGGGAESYSVALVEHLASQHEIHVFAQVIEHDWPGVNYHLVPAPVRKPRWINQLWYAWTTWRATRSGYDVVHSHENTWHGQVQTIHVQTVRHSLLLQYTGWRRALQWLKIGLSPRLGTYLALEAARFQCTRQRHVVVTSEALRAEASAAYPDAAHRMMVITPGVAMPTGGAFRSQARLGLGLPHTGPLLLFVANDYGRKGLGPLLEALSRLPAEVQLAVVGNAAQIPTFKSRADLLGVRDRVHFLGPLKSVDMAYRAATALVHPTLADTFAMVVLEAMAHGLPVVVSAPTFCGISGLLSDRRNALLLKDPRDGVAMAEVLATLLSDPAMVQRLSDEAQVFARRHSWETAAAAYARLYAQSSTLPA